MSKINVDNVIKVLNNGINYLLKIQTQWRVMARFFTDVKDIVCDSLTKNIESLSKNIEAEMPRNLILQEAVQATCYCIQVSNSANIYSITSRKYIVPELSAVGEEFALTQEEAKKRQSSIDKRLRSIMDEIDGFVKEKQEEYRARAKDRMDMYAKNLIKALPENTKKNRK